MGFSATLKEAAAVGDKNRYLRERFKISKSKGKGEQVVLYIIRCLIERARSLVRCTTWGLWQCQ